MSPSLTPPVVVLGPTSLVGRFLLPRLAAAGERAIAVSRRGAPADLKGFADWVEADIEGADWPARAPACATVFALSPLWVTAKALSALQARGMSRLVAFSSTSVSTKAASSEASERTVATRLADAEAAVARFCEVEGVAWTLLRPTMIYAEGRDANITRLARLIARWRVLPLAGDGRGLRQPVHADDLAEGAIAAATRPQTFRGAYDVPGGETLSYREMARRLFEAQGLRPRILPVPLFAWRLGLAAARPFLPGATAAMGERMAADLTFDGEPAARDFGWSPRPFHPTFPPLTSPA
jgi:nucleoside-diphosphate-sugar epimerase